MAAAVRVITPVKEFGTCSPVDSLNVHASSLFIGTYGSGHFEWEEPGEVKRKYSEYVKCMLQCGDVLWTATLHGKIKLFTVPTQQRIYTIASNKVDLLTMWRGDVLSTENKLIKVWHTNGQYKHQWKSDQSACSITVWNNQLCCGHFAGDITVWKGWNEKALTLKGHTLRVSGVVSGGEFLFSASYDCSIRKWNEQGQCVAVITHNKSQVNCVVLFNGELYTGAKDNTVLRMTLDGKLLAKLQGHTGPVKALAVWRGALFSGGVDRKIIQWTPFAVWSTATHSSFSPRIKEGIKTTLLLASKRKLLPGYSLPIDVLTIIFQYYATTHSLKTRPWQHAKRQKTM